MKLSENAQRILHVTESHNFSTIKHMTNFTWTGQSTQVAGNSYQYDYGDQALAITLTLNPNLTITHYHSTDPNPNPNPNLKITLTITHTGKLTLEPWKKLVVAAPSTPLAHTRTCTSSSTPSTESRSNLRLLVEWEWLLGVDEELICFRCALSC